MADGEMLPPPRKQQLSTNADFRKLLETPRQDRSIPDPTKPKKPAYGGGDGGMKPRKKKPLKPKAEGDEKLDDGPAYRDRAEERRKGFNPDYERVNEDMQGMMSTTSTGDMNGLSVEESKFLGGDVDHTHLVKGLDYALLQKVRGEIGKEGEDPVAALKSKKPSTESEVIKFKSAAGRGVFNAVFAKNRVDTSEFFLPGRTAFVFDLQSGFSSDIPTTLRRSKADCPPVQETVIGGMDLQVLERMVKIMSYMRGSTSKSGKLKRKEKLRMLQMMDGFALNGSDRSKQEAAATETSGPADADEDIFGDAGRDFVVQPPSKDKAKGADVPPPPPPGPPAPGPSVGPARPSGGYDAAAAAYAAYGENDDVPPPPPPPNEPQEPRHLSSQDEEDLELDRLAGIAPPPPPHPEDTEPVVPASLRPKRSKEDEIIPRDTEDAYEELYPGYGGFDTGLGDSDEEDLSHMDKKDEKSRYDFETEQQWEKYKSNKEMMPKAAFQFGVKMSDGRKGHKQLGKQVKQKEEQQFRKIQSLLDKQHGDRYKTAFSDPEKAKDSAGGGPSKKRRI